VTLEALAHHKPGEIRRITSAANEAVKAIRSLERKRERAESGLFLAEGARTLIEAIETGAEIIAVAHLIEAGEEAHIRLIVDAVQRRGGLILEVNREVLEKISQRDNPQTAIGVLRQRFALLDTLAPARLHRLVVLEDVRDPGNLGTILRTADALGAGAVVLLGAHTDPYGIEAVRASMGSIFAVPLVPGATDAFLAFAKAKRITLVGTHLSGARDIREIAWNDRVALVMGNEQKGLSDALAEACNVTVKIPMAGRADSLNLAVATAITLFESVRGR
jgi:TrmH family RNA methyltransferase